MASVPRVDIQPARLELTPGTPVLLTVTIYNPSEIVEGYSLVIYGFDASWVTTAPEELRLFPDTEGVVTATIDVPRGYPAGEHTIGLKVQPVAAAESPWIGQFGVSVAPVRDLTLTVSPASVTGRSRAEFVVAIDNHGNEPATLALEATDPEAEVSVEFTPQALTPAPGERSASQMRASGKRALLATPTTRVITVVAKGRGEPLEATATFVQKPWISQFLLSLLSVLVVLALWALVLLFGIDKVLSADEMTTTTVAHPGVITGRVSFIDTDGTSQPLIGAVVAAYSPKDLMTPVTPPGPVVTSSAAADTTTLGAGSYELDQLEPGSYLLLFTSTEFGDIWYSTDGGAADSTGATVVVVSDAGVSTPTAPSVTFNQTGAVCGTVFFAPPPAANGPSTTTSNGTSTTTTIASTTTTAPASGSAPDECSAYLPAGGQTSTTSTTTSSSTTSSTTTTAASSSTTTSTTTTTTTTPPADGADDATVGCPTADYPPPAGLLAGVVVTITATPAGGDGTGDGSTPVAVAAPVVTDRFGTFVIPNLPTPASYMLTFSRIGAADSDTTVQLGNGHSAEVTLTMVPGTGSITGTVAPAGDTGCPAVIQVSLAPTTAGVTAPTTATVVAAADGSYAIDGLASPGAYKLTFSQDDHQTSTATVMLQAGVPTPDVSVALAGAPGTIAGSIWDTAGEALGNVMVTVADQTASIVVKTDDADALFNFTGLATPGDYSVTFEKEGYVTQVVGVKLTPDSPTFEQEIIMAPVAATDLSAIFGTVTSESTGEGLSGVTVTVSDGSADNTVVTADDPAGSYEVTDLAPGAYTVTFTVEPGADGAATPPDPVTVLRQLAAGERLEVSVSLDVAASVSSLRLGVDGIGPFTFGRAARPVVAELARTLGTADQDTGRYDSDGEYGTCPGTQIRVTRFGRLRIVSTFEDAGEMFRAYRLDMAYDPDMADDHPSAELRTISGVQLGDQVQDAAAIYSRLDFEVSEPEDGEYRFTLRRPTDGVLLLWGPVTGPEPNDTISGIYSPDPCVEEERPED